MEYLEGIDLESMVGRHGPLPAARVVHILLQACSSLEEAHRQGLVHRDIKPANIYLCRRVFAYDFVKVLDFGLVKEIDAPRDAKLSTAGSLQGSPLYMAPESVTAPNSVDARADLYGLGAVAYFMLAGRPVFGGSLVEVLAHHLHSGPQPLSEFGVMDAKLNAIVFRCLEKDPNERFSCVVELSDSLRACESAEGWSRSQACAWWDSQRESIQAHQLRALEPARLTVAPA
jgi:serine/threonine-protein kinase